MVQYYGIVGRKDTLETMLKKLERLRQLFFPVPLENRDAFFDYAIPDILRKSCVIHLISAILQALNIYILLSRTKANMTYSPNPVDMGFFYFHIIALCLSAIALILFILLRKRNAFVALDHIFYGATMLLVMIQGFLARYEFYAVNQFFRLIIYFVIFSTLVIYSPLKGFLVILSGCTVFTISGSFFTVYQPQFYTLVGIPTNVYNGFMDGYANQNMVFVVTLCLCIFIINHNKAYRDFLFDRERAELIEQLDKANKQLLESSIKDALTSLNNRRALDDYSSRVWEECRSNGDLLSIMMVDADYFKAYNDGFGHQAGDDVLRTIAEVLKRNFSFMRGMLARYGGEEFIALIPGMNKEDVISAAEHIRAEVESLGIANPIPSHPNNVLTVSIGVYSVIASEAESIDKCIGLADDALYRAKSQGRNVVVVDG